MGYVCTSACGIKVTGSNPSHCIALKADMPTAELETANSWTEMAGGDNGDSESERYVIMSYLLYEQSTSQGAYQSEQSTSQEHTRVNSLPPRSIPE